MKKLLTAILIVFILTSNTLAQTTVNIKLNNEDVNTDTKAYIKNSRTLVPIRFISEALGYEVSWDNDNRTVKVIKDEKNITLKIDSKFALVGDKNVELDVAAEITNDRTFVPIRFIAENMGLIVDWDKDTYTVLLSNNAASFNMANLTNSEIEYFNKMIAISKSLQEKTDELKGYYFENASKYSNEELNQKLEIIKTDLDEIIINLNGLSVPDKFVNSNNTLKEAADTTRQMVNEYYNGLVKADTDAAKKIVALQTKLAIKLTELKAMLQSEVEGTPYVNPTTTNSNLLEDETLKNLFNKLGKN